MSEQSASNPRDAVDDSQQAAQNAAMDEALAAAKAKQPVQVRLNVINVPYCPCSLCAHPRRDTPLTRAAPVCTRACVIIQEASLSSRIRTFTAEAHHERKTTAHAGRMP